MSFYEDALKRAEAMIMEISIENAKNKQQRDALLAALKEVTDDFEASFRAEYSREPEDISYDNARKLISEIESPSKDIA